MKNRVAYKKIIRVRKRRQVRENVVVIVHCTKVSVCIANIFHRSSYVCVRFHE